MYTKHVSGGHDIDGGKMQRENVTGSLYAVGTDTCRQTGGVIVNNW